MTNEEFALQVEALRERLYKTAMLYLGNHAQALDALDEAVYKALCSHKKLRQPQYFNTWMTRILINECYNELRHQKRLSPLEASGQEDPRDFDTFSLKEAIRHLPKDLKDVVILRFFSGFTMAETARLLDIPQGTVATRQRRALHLLRLELGEEAEP